MHRLGAAYVGALLKDDRDRLKRARRFQYIPKTRW